MTAQQTRLSIPSWPRARSELANALKRRAPQPEVDALRAKFVTARTASEIQRLVATAPALTGDQVQLLHAVLDEAHAKASGR